LRGAEVRRWRVTTGDLEQLLDVSHNYGFREVSSPTGDLLAIEGEPPEIALFDGLSDRPVRVLNQGGPRVRRGIWSPDGKVLVAACRSKTT
jgi:hypothetical protein